VLSPHALHAGWSLADDARLSVYVNLGAMPVSLASLPQGKPFFSSEEKLEQSLSSGILPAFATVWYLNEYHG
jgi:hypothetical protein